LDGSEGAKSPARSDAGSGTGRKRPLEEDGLTDDEEDIGRKKKKRALMSGSEGGSDKDDDDGK
jgi:hypothetical protein